MFKRGTDILQARQLVQERLDPVTPTLPTWAAPPVMHAAGVGDQPRHEDRPVLEDDVVRCDLSMIAYWKIRARLLRVPGVANVAIWGERLQQLQV